jgi:hypothetical protein
MVTRRLGLVLAAALGGCAMEPSDEELENRNFTTTPGWGCYTCGFKNSPYLGKHPLTDFGLSKGMHDVVLQGVEAPTGLRHKVGFVGNSVEAYAPSGTVSGNALVGWKLVFDHKGTEYEAEILVYEQHPDWVDGVLIDTYSLGYYDPAANGEGPLENVCPGLSLDDTTIVFTPGETYDDATKTVVPGQSDLVTIGCRGHAIAKMKFMGHDPNDNYGSAVENRQATLKMLTADYCGDGVSHTEVGQPLDWMDELGLFSLSWTPTDDDLEARWNEDGAACLNLPRNPNVKRDGIGCTLPACTSVPADDLDGNRWASYHAP